MKYVLGWSAYLIIEFPVVEKPLLKTLVGSELLYGFGCLNSCLDGYLKNI